MKKKEQEILRIKREKEIEEGDGGGEMGESGRGGEQRKRKEPPYKFFFALALTRLSNTVLRMGVCAVWNGFMAVWTISQIKKQRGGGNGP